MGVLDNKVKQQNVNSASGLKRLLGGLLSSCSAKNEQSFLESILEVGGNGSIINDVTDMVLGGIKNKCGLVDLLSGLFWR